MRKRIAVVGLPSFGRRVADSLRGAGFDARFVERDQHSPRVTARMLWELGRADLVYGIGVSVARGSPFDLLARAGKRLLVHWVGTDVLRGLEARDERRLSARVLTGAEHWADAPWLVQELGALGIAPGEQLLPVPVEYGTGSSLPEEFRVMTYFPAQPHEAYDVAGTLAVAEALPEVPFDLAGGYEGALPANVKKLGLLDGLQGAYQNASVFLRLVNHDGMSHTVLEALSCGRYVLWSYPLEGVEQVGGVGDATAALRRLQERRERGELATNERGAAFVREHYGNAAVLDRACERLEALLA